MINKFVIFTFGFEGLPIALKLKQEGADVVLAVIEDIEDTLTDLEISKSKQTGDGSSDREDECEKNRRLSTGDGMVDKIQARKALQFLSLVDNKDEYFIFFDFNTGFRYAEELSKMGFHGNFPTQEDRIFEVDRNKAKEFVKKEYPEVRIAEHHEMSTVKEGIDFLNESDLIWCLKSNNDNGRTVVPDSDIVELAREQIIEALTSDKKTYEESGFILEQKILHPIEITPQKVYYNGVPVFTDIDLELKRIGAGDVGVMTGCSADVVFPTDMNARINRISFPKIVDEIAKKRRGMFVWDISLLIEPSTGNIYMGEFCPNRFGYNSLYNEISHSDGAIGFFNSIVSGNNPFVSSRGDFGSTIRLFNLHKDGKERRVLCDAKIDYELVSDNVFPLDVKKEYQDVVSVGYSWDLAVVSCVRETIEEAVRMCEAYAREVSFEGIYYRPAFDILSREYPTSILNRYDYLKKHSLI